jgi:hypothetical protein
LLEFCALWHELCGKQSRPASLQQSRRASNILNPKKEEADPWEFSNSTSLCCILPRSALDEGDAVLIGLDVSMMAGKANVLA